MFIRIGPARHRGGHCSVLLGLLLLSSCDLPKPVAPGVEMSPRIVHLFPEGSGAGRINNRGEVLISTEAGQFIWSRSAGYRAIPDEQWRALNDRGELVGTRGSAPDRQAIYWPGSGPVQVLPPPPGHHDAAASDINDFGVIVGGAFDPEFPAYERTGARVPVVWDGMEPSLLPIDPVFADYYASLEATAVNDFGDIVGTGTAPTSWIVAAWRNRQPTSGGGVDINNVGQVIGNGFNKEDQYDVRSSLSSLWKPAAPAAPIGPSAYSVTARAINDLGVVVGGFRYPDVDWEDNPYGWGPMLPFRWTHGSGLEPLPLPEGATGGTAGAVNALGLITGTVYRQEGSVISWNRGVIWATLHR